MTVRKIIHENNRVVLLHTSAVKVVNPKIGESALAYAQHHAASLATLVSENLKDELGLKAVPDSTAKIRALADCTVDSGGRTNFVLESLYCGEEFTIKGDLVVPEIPYDDHTLPHAVDTAVLEHFSGVEFHVVPGRRRIDILIGQLDKTLLIVLHECEGTEPEEPNYVLTRLGPVASGGRISATAHQNSLSSLRVQTTNPDNSVCECSELKKEIVALKETERQYELDDEAVMPFVSGEMAKKLIEPNIKVVDGQYKMPVPLNPDIIKKLPENYQNALKRTMFTRNSALRNSKLREVLNDTFSELIRESWIVLAEDSGVVGSVWYLPFFVTKSEKPRVVYDDAAMANGMCIKRAVLSGENLLNNLVEVLIRFRLGKYAFVTDIS